MNKNNFEKWQKVAGALFLLMLTGFVIALFVPSIEAIGVIFILSGYFFGLLVASKLGRDNPGLWMVLTFLFPYVLLPVLCFRNLKKVEMKMTANAAATATKHKSKVQSSLEKYLSLQAKSTISSLMKAGQIFNNLVDDSENRTILESIVLDKNAEYDLQCAALSIILKIEDKERVENLIQRLKNDGRFEQLLTEYETTEPVE